MSVTVRTATRADVDLIHGFICELADYEKLSHEVTARPQDLTLALFGPQPRIFAEIAERDGAAVGFALWFYNYSTFVGRCGLYLEDLYVSPAARGSGAGKELLRALARRCVEEDLGRFEWSVLDWNAPAIGFYDSLGAKAMDGWTIRRLDGEALKALAQ
jgi:GNAT superfamily N-acetyltransferase